MEEAIRNFPEQLSFNPVIENKWAFRPKDSFILCGMGGSHLAAGYLKLYDPQVRLLVHYDYGLPPLPDAVLKNSLLIASSYSGNTAETVDFAKQALEKRFDLFVIASGGTLIDFARQNNIAYILLPQSDIQPRDAVGYSLIALAKATSNDFLLNTLWGLKTNLNPSAWEEKGRALAENLLGKVPIIYASNTNHSLAYNWKIRFNETAKIPSFFNMFPELNHNELSGFDIVVLTKELSRNFAFIFLKDNTDHPAILERMDLTRGLYQDRGFVVEMVELSGANPLEKAFNSLFFAGWTSFFLAQAYKVNPDKAPLIDQFKTLLR